MGNLGSDNDNNCRHDEPVIRLSLWEHVTESVAIDHWAGAGRAKSSITRGLIAGLICLAGGVFVLQRFPPLKDTETGREIVPRALAAAAFFFYVAAFSVIHTAWQIFRAKPQDYSNLATQDTASISHTKTLKSPNVFLIKQILCIIPAFFFLCLAAADNPEDLYPPPIVLVAFAVVAIVILFAELLNICLYGRGRLELSPCPIYSGDKFDAQWIIPHRLLGKDKVHFYLRRLVAKGRGTRDTGILYQVYRRCRSLDLPATIVGPKPSLRVMFLIPEMDPAARFSGWHGAYWQLVITTACDRQKDGEYILLNRIKDFIGVCNPLNYRRTFILPVEPKPKVERA